MVPRPSLSLLPPSLPAHTRATLVGPAIKTSPTYSPGIQGWDFRWLELLVVGYPPSSSRSSSSSHPKSQPCIPEEYVGLVFLSTGAASIFGVALVSATLSTNFPASLIVKPSLQSSAFWNGAGGRLDWRRSTAIGSTKRMEGSPLQIGATMEQLEEAARTTVCGFLIGLVLYCFLAVENQGSQYA